MLPSSFSSILNVILFTFIIEKSHCSIHDIIKLDLNPTYGPPMKPDLMFKFISGGIPQIFWSFVNSSDFQSINFISNPCKRSLNVILDGLQDRYLTAYKFIDSSGKTPPGLMRGTLATFGDYDQCLSINDVINDEILIGKYCSFDYYSYHSEKNSNNSIKFEKITVFQGLPFVGSLCLPSKCSSIEVRQMLSTVLQPYSLKVTGDLTCDTKESVSMLTKLLSLNAHQIVALLFLGALINVVLLCTVIHLYKICIDYNVLPANLPKFEQLPTFIHNTSIVSGMRNIFMAKEQPHEVVVFDSMRTWIVLAGTLSHILICPEIPVSFFLVDRHDEIGYVFESPETQAFLVDAGLVGSAVLTGIATALVAYPLAVKSKLRFLPAFIDRILRFLPAMAVLTALELLWPLSGNGPLFTRVAEFIKNRCTKNWWRNLIFFNNYVIDSVDICAGSSFYLSVDMQLFIIGLSLISLLAWKPKTGYIFAGLCVLVSFIITSYNVFVHQVTGTLITANPNLVKIGEYFDYVHMSTPTYAPGYIIGIIVGFWASTGIKMAHITDMYTYSKCFITFIFIFSSVVVLTILYNSLGLLPEWFTFFVVIYNRTAMSILFSFGFAFSMAIKPWGDAFYGRKFDENGQLITDGIYRLDLLKAMSRLSFPLYLCNYLVIRALFFNSRNHLPTTVIDMGLRSISTLVLIYISSILFQIFFLTPFDSFRRYLTGSKVKTE